MKQVRETSAGKSISAWVVLNTDGELRATVQAHYGQNRTQVDIWAAGKDLQQGSASGYGYDKFTSALAGLTIDGVVLNDHCATNKMTEQILARYTEAIKKVPSLCEPTQEKRLRPKIENRYRKTATAIGACFANYTQFFVLPDGKEVTSWNFEPVKSQKAITPSYWRYTDLYLESGLKRLEMLGYRVIQAI